MYIITSSLRDFSLLEVYKRISETDILIRIEPLVDWDSLKPMVSSTFHNGTEKGGRSNFDEVAVIKALFVHEMYSLTDMSYYRDRGYNGAPICGLNATMDHASRNTPFTVDRIRVNRRITRKRSPGERPYSVIKGRFNGGHVHVTTVSRVPANVMFKCLCYNFFTLMSL